jgi:hypothetical protein
VTETGISRSVLSEAFAGRLLPSARTVDGIARACGAAPGPWVDRRDALAECDRRPKRNPAVVSVRSAVLFAVGSFALGCSASVVATMLMSAASTIEAGAPRSPATTGEDPASTTCIDDAAVATSEERAGMSLLEIVWSDKCQAGWGRITRYDGLSAGNTVTIVIYPETAPLGPDRQEATEHDVQGAYTNLVVRPTPDTLLCADGSFTV